MIDISAPASDLLGRNKKRHCVPGEIVFGVPGIADDAKDLQRERVGSLLIEAGFAWERVFKALKKNPNINFEVNCRMYKFDRSSYYFAQNLGRH